MSNLYLERYAWPEPVLTGCERYADVGYVVVLPACNEPEIQKPLMALDAALSPDKEVLVLIVVNESENASMEVALANKKTMEEASGFDTWYHLEVVHLRLPDKKAGVGLARKIGMDEAVRVFEHTGRDGVIICFDADCTCASNYLIEIEKYYRSPSNNAGLLYYEHSVNGMHATAIIRYELFLRYYIDALRYAGFPGAVQTLGSCITVRSKAYQKQGGMNTRKAGEDFYFIHKMMPIGGIGEINSTCVYPSDRISDRVPFGTGHAIQKYLDQKSAEYPVYSPSSFEDLRQVFATCHRYYEKKAGDLTLPTAVSTFYEETHFEKDLVKILKQSNNPGNFGRKFFVWWDAFRVLKFVHFARDHFYPNVPIQEATNWLGHQYLSTDISPLDLPARLALLRHMDRISDFKAGDTGLSLPTEGKK